MIERVLQLRIGESLEADAEPVTITSAGVLAPLGWPMDGMAAQELQRLGGDAGGHLSRQFDASMVQGADLILTVTRDVRSRVLEEFPGALRRSFTLREFSAIATSGALDACPVRSTADFVRRAAECKSTVRPQTYDVLDPIGQSPEFHRSIADVIDAECRVVARAVTADLRNDTRSKQATQKLF